MAVCSKIKGVTRKHEWVSNLFSLMAVVMLFGTIWAGVEYQRPLLSWMSQNVILHGGSVIAAIVLDVFLIILFLNIGSSRFPKIPVQAASAPFVVAGAEALRWAVPFSAGSTTWKT